MLLPKSSGQRVEKDFEPTLIVDQKGYVTYGAKRVLEYRSSIEEESCFVNATKDNQIIGIGRLSFVKFNTDHPVPFIHDKPFVRFIETKKAFAGQNYATQMLLFMNEIAKQTYNTSLYSGVALLPDGVELFKKLHQQGIVEEVAYFVGNEERKMYRFI